MSVSQKQGSDKLVVFANTVFVLPSVKPSCRGLHTATGHSDATPSTEMHRYISHHVVADMKQTQTKVSEYVHLSESTKKEINLDVTKST